MTGLSRKIMPLALLDAWPCNYAQGVSGVQNLANKLDKCTDAYERGNLIRNFNNDQSQMYSARNESDGLTFFGETSKKRSQSGHAPNSLSTMIVMIAMIAMIVGSLA